MTYTLYNQDAINVVKHQIDNTPAEQIHFSCEDIDAISHTMNAVIDIKSSTEPERFIKTSCSTAISRNQISDKGEQSVIGCPQLFSDKYQISLSAVAAQFHPLHATLMSFSENARRHILRRTTIVAYLPGTL